MIYIKLSQEKDSFSFLTGNGKGWDLIGSFF